MASSPAMKVGVSSRSARRFRGTCIIWLALFAFALELGFLIRLDQYFAASFLSSFPSMPQFLRFSSAHSNVSTDDVALDDDNSTRNFSAREQCVRLLEEQDALNYTRDFSKQPVLVIMSDTTGTENCAVGCTFTVNVDHGVKPDATFGNGNQPSLAHVHRSMESAAYYEMNDIGNAQRRGYNIVMTTNLSSDVPVGYFSWSEYDIMAPVQKKIETSIAAAFISNCGSSSFRLEALDELQKLGVTIDSYGLCKHNVDRGYVDKVKALQNYKFSLAFENSMETDYVTEKFWQSLVSGSVPVVIGAPNIHDFVPAPNSIIHIKSLEEVKFAAAQMKYLASNETAYNETLRWKIFGPSDKFKALVDMAAVHSSCRLCIHIATKIRLQEEALLSLSRNHTCRCTSDFETWFHLYVRERGRFEMESLYLSSNNLTIQALKEAIIDKFRSKLHVPIWEVDRPAALKGGNTLRIYKVYRLGSTQRDALYTNQLEIDEDLRKLVESNPCLKLEVIFV